MFSSRNSDHSFLVYIQNFEPIHKRLFLYWASSFSLLQTGQSDKISSNVLPEPNIWSSRFFYQVISFVSVLVMVFPEYWKRLDKIFGQNQVYALSRPSWLWNCRKLKRLTGLPYSGAPVPLLPPPSIWVTPSTWKKIYNMTKEFSVHALLSSIAAKGGRFIS